jgi:hypothetical protein
VELAELRGRVRARNGTPVKGALVVPRSLDFPRKRIPEIAVITDRSGLYNWRLPPGRYSIEVRARGYRRSAKIVRLRRAVVQTLNFVVVRL